MYQMVDEGSLPSRVRFAWTNWVKQVSIFGFNSGKYDLNMVKHYVAKTVCNLNDVKVAKSQFVHVSYQSPV